MSQKRCWCALGSSVGFLRQAVGEESRVRRVPRELLLVCPGRLCGFCGRQWEKEVGCAAFREKHRDLLHAYAPPAKPQQWPPNPSMQVRLAAWKCELHVLHVQYCLWMPVRATCACKYVPLVYVMLVLVTACTCNLHAFLSSWFTRRE